jgi:hypothetical protein
VAAQISKKETGVDSKGWHVKLLLYFLPRPFFFIIRVTLQKNIVCSPVPFLCVDNSPLFRSHVLNREKKWPVPKSPNKLQISLKMPKTDPAIFMTNPFNSDVGPGGKIPPKYSDVPPKYFLKDWHGKIALCIYFPGHFLYILQGALQKKL